MQRAYLKRMPASIPGDAAAVSRASRLTDGDSQPFTARQEG